MSGELDEKGLLDRICHKEQIGIWANEVLTALSLGDFLREEWSFDDTVDAEREIEAQLRSMIASAISHPEYDLMAKLTAAEAQVLRLTEENEALRKERTSLIETKREQIERLELSRGAASKVALDAITRAEAAEARIKALEEALNWALGCGDDFRHREEGEGVYWWRKELAERAGMTYDREAGIYRAGDAL